MAFSQLVVPLLLAAASTGIAESNATCSSSVYGTTLWQSRSMINVVDMSDQTLNITCKFQMLDKESDPGDTSHQPVGVEYGECVTESGEKYYLLEDQGVIERIPPLATAELTVEEVLDAEPDPIAPWTIDGVPLYRVLSIGALTPRPKASLLQRQHRVGDGPLEVTLLVYIIKYSNEQGYYTKEKLHTWLYAKPGDSDYDSGSFAEFLELSSYGRIVAPREAGEIVYVQLDKPNPGCSGLDGEEDFVAAARMQNPGLDPDKYHFHLVYYDGLFPEDDYCGWAGVASVGCGHPLDEFSNSGPCSSWYVCGGTPVIQHELGHNFGLLHADGWGWGGNYSYMAAYGDDTSVMGASYMTQTYSLPARHQMHILKADEWADFYPAGKTEIFKIASQTYPPGTVGEAKMVGLSFACPECNSHNRGYSPGGHIWVGYRSDHEESFEHIWEQRKNKIFVHFERRYDSHWYGAGTELWAVLQKGEFYRDEYMSVAVVVCDVRDEVATIALVDMSNPSAQEVAEGECDENNKYDQYRGCHNRSLSGRPCQKWTAQEPHAHDTTPENYPENGLGDHNYCRAVHTGDMAGLLWCYTADPSVRWEWCTTKKSSFVVEQCKGVAQTSPPKIVCDETQSGDGSDYRGCQDTTTSGWTCQNWYAIEPHDHSILRAGNPGEGIGDHNYCRNPDGEPQIWCYTTNPRVRWEYCEPRAETITTTPDLGTTTAQYWIAPTTTTTWFALKSECPSVTDEGTCTAQEVCYWSGEVCKAKETCYQQGFRRKPVDMDGQERSQEPSPESCQRRCAQTEGCWFFSFWSDGGCHLQAIDSTQKADSGAVTGPARCQDAVPNDDDAVLVVPEDAEIGGGESCTSVSWEDSSGWPCEAYGVYEFCTPGGGYGGGWVSGSFDDFSNGGYTALSACCQCGGGFTSDGCNDMRDPVFCGDLDMCYWSVDGQCKPKQTCYTADARHTPLDMPGQGRSGEGSVEDCQERCAQTPGCAYFSYWADGGCHLQDSHATAQGDRGTTTGPAVCPDQADSTTTTPPMNGPTTTSVTTTTTPSATTTTTTTATTSTTTTTTTTTTSTTTTTTLLTTTTATTTTTSTTTSTTTTTTTGTTTTIPMSGDGCPTVRDPERCGDEEYCYWSAIDGQCKPKELCYTSGMKRFPEDMRGQGRSVEENAEACQARCARTAGCWFFSFWGDGGCHLQDIESEQVGAWDVTTGPVRCQDQPPSDSDVALAEADEPQFAEGSPGCPHNYEQVMDSSTCRQDAAQALGAKSGRESSSREFPKACYSTRGSFNFNTHKFGNSRSSTPLVCQRSCTSEPWTDSGGWPCAAYGAYDFCTAAGGYGRGWMAGSFDDFASDGHTAEDACCECGGGSAAR